MTDESFECSSCGIDHREPTVEDWPAIVAVRVGPHKGKIGAAIEWRRYGGQALVRVVVGLDYAGREIRENFNPCDLKVLTW